MSIESLSRQEVERRVAGWAVSALVSCTIAAGGIYGWVKQEQNPSTLEQQCREITAQARNLEETLFKDGTLGSDGGLIVRYLEIRNPDDGRLREWGQSKNERDRVCAERQKERQNSHDGWIQIAAMAGSVFSFFSVYHLLFFRRLFRTKPAE